MGAKTVPRTVFVECNTNAKNHESHLLTASCHLYGKLLRSEKHNRRAPLGARRLCDGVKLRQKKAGSRPGLPRVVVGRGSALRRVDGRHQSNAQSVNSISFARFVS